MPDFDLFSLLFCKKKKFALKMYFLLYFDIYLFIYIFSMQFFFFIGQLAFLFSFFLKLTAVNFGLTFTSLLIPQYDSNS